MYGGNWGMRSLLYGQSPTRETIEHTPTTQNVIPFLHWVTVAGTIFIGLVAIGALATVWYGPWLWLAIWVVRGGIGLAMAVLALTALLSGGKEGGIAALVLAMIGIAGLWAVGRVEGQSLMAFRWMTTFAAVGLVIASVLLFIAARRELIDPYMPLPPRTRVLMEWVKGEKAKQQLELAQMMYQMRREGVEIPPSIQTWGPAPEDRGARLHRFLRDCAQSTRRDDLRQQKWSNDEIVGYRDLLIRSRFARDKGRHQGWELLFSPDEIMEHYGSAGLHSLPPSVASTVNSDKLTPAVLKKIGRREKENG